MFLLLGPLPLAPLWAKFFKGHERPGFHYVHAAENLPLRPRGAAPGLQRRQIHISKVRACPSLRAKPPSKYVPVVRGCSSFYAPIRCCSPRARFPGLLVSSVQFLRPGCTLLCAGRVARGDITLVRRASAACWRTRTPRAPGPRFVLLSESCIPVHSFETVYHYLLLSNHSFCGGRKEKGGTTGAGQENSCPW